MSNTDAIGWLAIQQAIVNWVVQGGGSDIPAGNVFWEGYGRPRAAGSYVSLRIKTSQPIGHDWSTTAANILVLPTQTVQVVTPAAGLLRIPSHPFNNGDGPVQVSSTGTLPGGLAALTDYWVIVVDANTIQLATSYVHTGGQQPLGAGNPQTPLTFSNAGSGTITVNTTPNSNPAGQELQLTAQGFRMVTMGLKCVARAPAGADPTAPAPSGFDAVRIMHNVAAALQLNIYALDAAGAGFSDLGQAFSQSGIQSLETKRGDILEPMSTWDVIFYVASVFTGYVTVVEQVSGNIKLTLPDGSQVPNIPFDFSTQQT